MADDPMTAPAVNGKNGNGKSKDDPVGSSVTMRWTALSATWGIILLGGACVFVKPQFPEGTTLVLATLTGLVGGIIGGKLGSTIPGGAFGGSSK